jgi:hypothetical protein
MMLASQKQSIMEMFYRNVILGIHKTVIVRMSADPNPCHCVGGQPAQRAMVISDANAEAIPAALQTAEME